MREELTGQPIEKVDPKEIERRSFEIITGELADMGIRLDPKEAPVIKRCIHTSADFDYAKNLYFSGGVMEKALEAVRKGALIVTDTNMGKAGINKAALLRLNGEALCFMADPDVAEEAGREGTTRAEASIKKAARTAALQKERPLILAVGNAPTALFKACELIEKGELKAELVIGVPVGFVNVVQAKERLIASGIPCIAARGRKGGSNIAAAICNALLYMAEEESASLAWRR